MILGYGDGFYPLWFHGCTGTNWGQLLIAVYISFTAVFMDYESLELAAKPNLNCMRTVSESFIL